MCIQYGRSKCPAGVEKNIPEIEANCVLAQGPLVVEQSWLTLGERVLFSVLLEVRCSGRQRYKIRKEE